MHLDLGAAVSQMFEGCWVQARLMPTNVELRIVDEVASVRRVTKVGIGDVAKPVAVSHVTFASYIESRFGKETVDGALGLDFFRGYAVFASWDKRTFYLKPRDDKTTTTTTRLDQWNAMIKPCAHP